MARNPGGATTSVACSPRMTAASSRAFSSLAPAVTAASADIGSLTVIRRDHLRRAAPARHLLPDEGLPSLLGSVREGLRGGVAVLGDHVVKLAHDASLAGPSGLGAATENDVTGDVGHEPFP